MGINNMSKADVFYCTTDESSHETIQEAVEFIGDHASSLKDALGWVIEIHEKDHPTHDRFVDGESLIEMFEQNAYDNFSEYAEDYLGDIFANKDKCKELELLVSDWLDKNAQQPSFYQSKKKVGSIVVDQELLNNHDITFD